MFVQPCEPILKLVDSVRTAQNKERKIYLAA